MRGQDGHKLEPTLLASSYLLILTPCCLGKAKGEALGSDVGLIWDGRKTAEQQG